MSDIPVASVSGHFQPGFERVEEAFKQNFTDRGELGAAVSVMVSGASVVDLWGGWMDPDRKNPWKPQTLTNVWSATKGMTAICALKLAEARDLDVDAPVARYWPEFAQAGKRDI